MSNCKIEILAPAIKELEEITDYHLLMVGPISAKKIIDKILNSLARLEEFPLSCPYVPDTELKNEGYRMLVCDKYVCIYRLLGDTVYIYHIAPGATEYGKLIKGSG
ncbi:type II toxin-antitoxin system RelE/ParE family toxin [uncultured Acetobacterium sp.]|jgi:plasmid stabilization system protein ParE|uniref:type II toxin-antitoxin system RelE/ParE family toxin n=1 Tax=uncultured Acetobacterium sp. TaxID=217139 RepID=UPI0025F9E21D|nr:type II toxin-antitoxin system RelE/ParE family toxin [uncultured Acetobacterium sp.]